MDQIYEELLVEIECPICTNYMAPPIRQCTTGHSICETCRKKLQKCPMCQGKFTQSRNISLEGLAQKMFYPCVYKMSGCTSALSYSNRENHEKNCSFRGFQCAMEKCNWVGTLEDLAVHWASKKMTSKAYSSSNVCHTKMKNESYYVNMVNAFNKMFWFKCKLLNRKLYWAVQYIGNVEECERFYYEIEAFKLDRTKRKILISDYCQRIDTENHELFKEGNCIVLNIETVEHLLNDDQTLVYYMRIHPVKGASLPCDAQHSGNAQESSNNKQRDRSKGPNQNKYVQKPKKFQVQHKARQNKEGFVVL